ncbi:LmeA family phospholipid-binding protein [Salinibacterium sp. PAMC 21357]|uniref:LmeA family phospholipid-binding protein n=1 Tax=Salinibacterium sp. PAMC 21357 TaxID=1112215 RepID=UPI000288B602|nr:LmeA family phospholipid-binding protein [Salinibacterium sp. PAMC 21357]
MVDDARRDDVSPDDGTQPTLDLGAQPTVELVLGGGTTPESAPTKKRRSGKGWWIAGGIIAVILIVGVVLVETVGRAAAENLVRDEIVSSLGIDSADGIAVDLGSGSLVWQALTGGIDVVTIDLDRVEVNGLEASAHIVATEVPLSPSKPLETFSMRVAVPGAEIDKLATTLSGIELDSIELQDSAIRVSTTFRLLFISLPVAVDLLPVAAGDSIAFEPQSVLLGDQQISVADLRDNPLVSGLAGNLLSSQKFCVASSMPAALTIDSVAVDASELVIDLSADDIALGDDQWQQYGVCPEQ